MAVPFQMIILQLQQDLSQSFLQHRRGEVVAGSGAASHGASLKDWLGLRANGHRADPQHSSSQTASQLGCELCAFFPLGQLNEGINLE